jgi:hypothetical protein
MPLTVDPNKVEVLFDRGQTGMQIIPDYSETLYSAEFGDGNVAFARVGVGEGLRTYKFSWSVTYGFQDPALVQAATWDHTNIEGLQSRPQYMFRFLYRRFGTNDGEFAGSGPLCWIHDPIDFYYRLFRPIGPKPSFQQGDKYDRWSYSCEFRQVRAQFSAKVARPDCLLISPTYGSVDYICEPLP